MPLRDHFRPPLHPRFRWESFHAAWATMMTRRLNGGVLPRPFRAAPLIQFGVHVEIDVATVEEALQQAAAGQGAGGVATAVWAPALPVAADIAFDEIDLIEVEVYDDSAGAKLVGAVELVSPRNKDRADARRAFAAKCVSLLQAGVGLVVVDVVTERRANMHAELLDVLRKPDLEWEAPSRLSAVAYRVWRPRGGCRFEFWPEPLSLGAALPRVPLWLAPDRVVPLDLDLSYQDACELLLVNGEAG